MRLGKIRPRLLSFVVVDPNYACHLFGCWATHMATLRRVALLP